MGKSKKFKPLSKKVIDVYDKVDYKFLASHPAVELLRLLPHTSTYALMNLLYKVLNEYFEMGYECGHSDGRVETGR